MWTAIVYACTVGITGPALCTTFEDDTGPRATLTACQERLEEMKADAADILSELDDGAVRGWCELRDGVAPASRVIRRGGR